MNILWLIFICFLFLIAETRYYDRYSLKGVRYTRYLSQTAVSVGDTVELVEVLQNRKLAPLPWLRVESRISSALRFKSQDNLDIDMEQFHRSIFFLGGFSRITRRHEITCVRRGYYTLTQNAITAGDLFGIVNQRKDIPCDAALFVYPSLQANDRLPWQALKWQGDLSVHRWIMPDPVLVGGVREYREGDPQKDIHWAATARTGQLQVKVRDFTVSARVLVILNAQISENLWGLMRESEQEVIEGGIRIAATMMDWCLRQGIETGFASNGALKGLEEKTIYIPPAASETQMETLMQTLARLMVIRNINFHSMLSNLADEGVTGMDIIILSAYDSDAVQTGISDLRRRGNTVSVIPIDAEEGAYASQVG